jgi:hypothetical protein
LGTLASLAIRLQGEAIPGEAMCVSEGTYKVVKDDVEVKTADGRVAKPKIMDEVRVGCDRVALPGRPRALLAGSNKVGRSGAVILGAAATTRAATKVAR